MASKSTISRKEPYGRGPSAAAAKAAAVLSLSGGSHGIAKTQAQQRPKVRIVHMYAPRIIKVEAHNFRATVQRLTGKPQPAPPGTTNDHSLINNDNNNKKQQLLKRQRQQQIKEATGILSPHSAAGADRDQERIASGEMRIEPWDVEEIEKEIRKETTRTSGSGGIHDIIVGGSGGFLDGLGDLGIIPLAWIL